MTSWSFILDFPKPPVGLSMNDRVHWGRKAKSTAQVRLAVFAHARRLEIPALKRCRVDVVWIVRTNHKRDTDNLAPLLKAIYDGLGSNTGVSAHIVADDSPEFMEKPGATIRHDKTAQPHFEVTVTAIS